MALTKTEGDSSSDGIEKGKKRGSFLLICFLGIAGIGLPSCIYFTNTDTVLFWMFGFLFWFSGGCYWADGAVIIFMSCTGVVVAGIATWFLIFVRKARIIHKQWLPGTLILSGTALPITFFLFIGAIPIGFAVLVISGVLAFVEGFIAWKVEYRARKEQKKAKNISDYQLFLKRAREAFDAGDYSAAKKQLQLSEAIGREWQLTGDLQQSESILQEILRRDAQETEKRKQEGLEQERIKNQERLEQERIKHDTAVNRIKGIVVDFSKRFPRVQVSDLVEESGESRALIIRCIKEMIEQGQIRGKYFESSESIAFDITANRDDIEKMASELDKNFTDWSEKEKDKDEKKI
nr:hypothetical protein [Candidatus Sigynarchaeota archaeon]